MTQANHNNEADTTTVAENKLLSFYVNNRLFAIPIEYVSEIIGIQNITYVPRLPDYISGITNIRGKVVPLVELRRRFNEPPAGYNDRTCIVIIEKDTLTIGCIVDEIADVLNVNADEQINKIPGDAYAVKFVYSMIRTNSKIAFLLDIDKICDPDE